MQLLAADYVLLGLAVAGFVFGLFCGFSGALAFLAGSLAGAAAAVFGWRYSGTLIEAQWLRALAVLVATLVVFGLVRLVVAKSVNKLLSQPADAIFGAVAGLFGGILPTVFWAYGGIFLEYSALAAELSSYVR